MYTVIRRFTAGLPSNNRPAPSPKFALATHPLNWIVMIGGSGAYAPERGAPRAQMAVLWNFDARGACL